MSEEIVKRAMDGDAEAKNELFIAGKRAFRIAWEFWEKHLMPDGSHEYWAQTAKDVTEIKDDDNLTERLIMAVFGNLEWMVKVKESTAE